MATAGTTAEITEGNSCASRESGLLCSHSHGESIAFFVPLSPPRGALVAPRRAVCSVSIYKEMQEDTHSYEQGNDFVVFSAVEKDS